MEIIINYLVFIFIYLLPFIFFICIYKHKMNKIVISIFSILYILVSFISLKTLMNLLPFCIVIINIYILKIMKDNDRCVRYSLDYDRYNFRIGSVKVGECIKYILLSYFVVIVISMISYFIFTKFHIELKQQEIINRMLKMKNKDLIMTLPAAVVFAPLVEEFVFRYILFERIFKNRIGIYAAAILSSLLFAFLHYNLKTFPMILCIGLINCYLIEKKGYWYSVFNHAFFNSMSSIGIIILRVYGL